MVEITAENSIELGSQESYNKNHMMQYGDDAIFIEFGFFRNVSSLKISNV